MFSSFCLLSDRFHRALPQDAQLKTRCIWTLESRKSTILVRALSHLPVCPARRDLPATPLADGRVLVTAACTPNGHGGTAQLFEPGTGVFSFHGSLNGSCYNGNTATLLTNGKVLFAGNDDDDGSPANTELYGPTTGTFASLEGAIGADEFSTATLLLDGTVLIAGGQLPGGAASAGVDVYDPVDCRFSPTGNMATTRYGQTATLLPDGRVLIAGGLTGQHPYSSPSDPNQPTMTTTAELYTSLELLPRAALLSPS